MEASFESQIYNDGNDGNNGSKVRRRSPMGNTDSIALLNESGRAHTFRLLASAARLKTDAPL